MAVGFWKMDWKRLIFRTPLILLTVGIIVGVLAEKGGGAETWLLDMAKKEFDSITPAEEKLFLAVAGDKVADYRDPNNKEANDPNKADKWGPERILRGDRIEWAWSQNKVRRMMVRGARVEGYLSLPYKKTEGALGLVGCQISEGIRLMNAEVVLLELEDTRCGHIAAQGLFVDGDANLENMSVTKGGVNLLGAKVGRNLEMDGAHVENRTGYAFAADRLEVGGNLSMSGDFVAVGAVSLNGAKVGSQLNCIGGQFFNERGRALNAEGIEVRRCINLREGFVAHGGVHLSGAHIGGEFACNGGSFINPGGVALSMRGAQVGESVHLGDGFRAEGQVSLQNTIIEGQLEFLNCELSNEGHDAIVGEGLNVGKNMYLYGLKGAGTVNLSGARVAGTLRWQVASPKEFSLDLRDATVGTLWDDRESWPAKGRLFLHGFVYTWIYDKATMRVDERIDWLHRQPDERYRAQPYEQLAKVLRESGHDEAAKQILIAKEEERLRLTSMSGTTRFFWRLWGWFMDYGYHPLNGLRGILLILPGWLFFWLAKWGDWIRPCQSWAYSRYGKRRKVILVKEYPAFSSLLYSIEVFIPVVNLEQMRHWLPKCPDTRGKALGVRAVVGLLYFLLWLWIVFEIISGWVILSMLIAGVTLLIRS